MEDSPLSLARWAVVLWIVHQERQVSSYRLHRALGVTQKSAWLLLQRVREAVGRSNSQSIEPAINRNVPGKNLSKSFQRWVGRILSATKSPASKHGTWPAS